MRYEIGTYDEINENGKWISEIPTDDEVGLKLYTTEDEGKTLFVLKEETIEGIIKNEVMIEQSEVEKLKSLLN